MTATRLIEKSLSLLVPVTVIACALFGARIVNDFIEAQYIGEASAATSPAKRVVRPEPTSKARSKAGATLTARNMFCSECETSSLEPATAVASAGDGVSDTQLPLRLVTTNVSTDPSSSFASLVNTASGHKGAYWSGQKIPGAGPIEKISGRYVDFLNTTTNRIERIRLDRPVATAAAPVNPKRPNRRTASSKDSLNLDDKVRKINATTWEVDRSVLQSLMSNPRALRGTRVVPNVKNGSIAGFKVSRLSSRSPVAKIGIKRGDVIRAANGVELNGPDVVLGFVGQVQSLNRVVVTVERGGKNIDLTYMLR